MTEVATEVKEEVVEKVEDDVVDILQPKAEPKTWTLIDDQGNTDEYVQKPLSFFGKMEFFSLVGDTIDSAMSGDNGLTVNGVLGALTQGAPNPDNFSAEDFLNADAMMAAAAKVAGYAPNFLKDCYCIWLSIPYKDRPWAKLAFENLSDDDGIEIIEIFVDQNAEAIKSFFVEKLGKLGARIRTQIENRDDKSVSSKPSKPTRRNTRKQSTNS